MPRPLLLCLLAALAGCDRLFGPDGGLIAGTVTLAPSTPSTGAADLPAGAPRLEVLPAPHPGAVPGVPPAPALVVTFHRAAVDAPRHDSPALRTRAASERVSERMRDGLARHAGLPFRLTDLSPAAASARLRLATHADGEAVRRALLQDPRVARVEWDGYAYRAAERLPDATLYPVQAWHYEMADLPRAWALTTGSEAVLVAVVDDGIRFDHPDLAPNLTGDGYDFVSSTPATLCSGETIDLAGDGDGPDPDPTVPASHSLRGDCLVEDRIGGHGTHVAGTVGAAGGGVTGAAWTVRIRPVRVLNTSGTGSWFDVAQGILYAAGLPAADGRGGTVQAASGARIINLSLGGPADAPVLREAVLAASGAGSLLVAAALNHASAAPHYPAAYPEVVSVAAVGPGGSPASYSNRGPSIDLAAPGGDFAAGIGPSFGVTSTLWHFADARPAYASWSGTSMAAPHVSGIAALLLAREPGLSAAALRARLLDFAADAGAPGRDDRYGAGIVNARNALTRTHAPARSLLVSLYDADTGRRVRTVAAPGGRYSASGLPRGRYFVFAGEDEEGDGRTGVPGRRWGAFGGAATPQAVEVGGGSRSGVSFEVGLPSVPASVADSATPGRLVAGGYAEGRLSTFGSPHHYAATLPAGTYTFATAGRGGACRHALAADTELTLFGPSGQIAHSDDVDPSRRDFCSRITATLAAGTYLVRVSTPGWPGAYALMLREGG
jgi:subtilisin family serine protease